MTGKEATAAAAAGDGSPVNDRGFASSAGSTLYRASRSTVQMTYMAATIHISRRWYPNGSENWSMSSAGAAPKLMASHSESSSAPNALVCLVSRAVAPSSASNTIAA